MRANIEQKSGLGVSLKAVVRAQFAAALAFGTVACAGSQAHQVQEAEVEAVEKSADQQADAIDERGEARNDSIEQSADAQQDAIDENMHDPPEELAEERVELQQEQETFVSNTRTKLSKLEVRVDEAERKLQLNNANTTDLKEEVRAARMQINSLEQELQTLKTVQPKGWDAAKSKMEHRLSELSERVEMLQDKADT